MNTLLHILWQVRMLVLALLLLGGGGATVWVGVRDFQAAHAESAPTPLSMDAIGRYSPQTGRYGYTSGAACLPDSEAGAVANSGACDAQVVLWVADGWAAIARSPDGSASGYGLSTRSLAEAEAISLRGCAQSG
jgi:Domain of unknown function (DUF4189)